MPAVHFELTYFGTPGIKVTPIVSENLQAAQAAITIENVHLWDGLNDPYLYTATASLDSGDEAYTR